ncbi:ImmA/IrrE family metallo-endopeptidase [Achromobacter spanius]|uniref:ImmA/IrrE family metallo-endopeptidase n=1 Tax=Achromobacter spanius TaxID=217203 RepID=UPI00222758DD|nr:ImmA/IrrE family metallo-endopeptidase [Achromobacter spanius]MCW3151923.1 ImmA/IrrE family metallo-endopeptidase [Achromobacter spanius]
MALAQFANRTTAAAVLDEARSKKMPWDAPIPVDGIAQMLGARVIYDHTLEERGVIGEIKFLSDGPVIGINPFENSYEPRRRFTLAHELGHLCLHANERGEFTDSRKTMSRTESYWDRFESEANNFAAELLMPAELIIKIGEEIWARYWHDFREGASNRYMIDNLAARFQVSNQAMEYRLGNLNLLR